LEFPPSSLSDFILFFSFGLKFLVCLFFSAEHFLRPRWKLLLTGSLHLAGRCAAKCVVVLHWPGNQICAARRRALDACGYERRRPDNTQYCDCVPSTATMVDGRTTFYAMHEPRRRGPRVPPPRPAGVRGHDRCTGAPTLPPPRALDAGSCRCVAEPYGVHTGLPVAQTKRTWPGDCTPCSWDGTTTSPPRLLLDNLFFFEKHILYCVSKKKALSGSTAEPHVYYTDNEEEYVSTLYTPQCPRDYNVGEIRAASMISNQMSVSCAMGCRAGTLRRLSQS
jgi:hypothetical protein